MYFDINRLVYQTVSAPRAIQVKDSIVLYFSNGNVITGISATQIFQ